uniref:Uncharacterized protein n=1 Tax=Chlamydomonas euryale TaxID=1486919 RepID=A0A7R9VW74_9CHLO|mmetsp:Transcript_45535/g.135807  ORF Transcript_45535/g.135807 Transcript_45535/m.135807 type:complete len:489 (+) Transcript_45535:802-2268(+)|eukprot:357329-Chlamydomonas_euryale.AAC.17
MCSDKVLRGVPTLLLLLLAAPAVLASASAQRGDRDNHADRGSRTNKRGDNALSACLLADADLVACPGNSTLTCENTAGDHVCVHGRILTDCPAPAELDHVGCECPAPKQLGCLLPENATACPSNRTLSCKNSNGDVICVLALSAAVCPEPAELDGVDRECRVSSRSSADGEDGADRPFRSGNGRGMLGTPNVDRLHELADRVRAHVRLTTSCLLADAGECLGNNTLTCENTGGDLVCVRGRNMTNCPAPAELDQVDRGCPAPQQLGCLLPENATECHGNRTPSCENSAGDIICMRPLEDGAVCPDPAELDAIDMVCRDSLDRIDGGPDHGPSACKLADADLAACPGDSILTCENTAGDLVCVRNLTDCPASAELDQVDRKCPVPKQLGCLLPENATECYSNRTLSCENSAGNVICVPAFRAIRCPLPAELDGVDRECRDINRSSADRGDDEIEDGNVEDGRARDRSPGRSSGRNMQDTFATGRRMRSL